MKNLFLSIAIVFLSLTSCSKDDDSTTTGTPSGVLPTKIVSTYSGGQVSTSTFTYAGNKIVEELIVPAEDVSKIKYTYTGDNITKIEEFSGLAFDAFGGLILTYENGKVKTSTTIAVAGYVAPNTKTTNTYNTDGTITVTTSSIDQITGVETPNLGSVKLTYASGNLVKRERFSSTSVLERTETFTFDTAKNAAFKNVTGFDQTLAEGNLKLTETGTNVGQASNVNKTWTYNYNADNFPSQVVQPNAYGSQSKTQVFTY
jgi:hypothetical protein